MSLTGPSYQHRPKTAIVQDDAPAEGISKEPVGILKPESQTFCLCDLSDCLREIDPDYGDKMEDLRKNKDEAKAVHLLMVELERVLHSLQQSGQKHIEKEKIVNLLITEWSKNVDINCKFDSRFYRRQCFKTLDRYVDGWKDLKTFCKYLSRMKKNYKGDEKAAKFFDWIGSSNAENVEYIATEQDDKMLGAILLQRGFFMDSAKIDWNRVISHSSKLENCTPAKLQENFEDHFQKNWKNLLDFVDYHRLYMEYRVAKFKRTYARTPYECELPWKPALKLLLKKTDFNQANGRCWVELAQEVKAEERVRKLRAAIWYQIGIMREVDRKRAISLILKPHDPKFKDDNLCFLKCTDEDTGELLVFSAMSYGAPDCLPPERLEHILKLSKRTNEELELSYSVLLNVLPDIFRMICDKNKKINWMDESDVFIYEKIKFWELAQDDISLTEKEDKLKLRWNLSIKRKKVEGLTDDEIACLLEDPEPASSSRSASAAEYADSDFDSPIEVNTKPTAGCSYSKKFPWQRLSKDKWGIILHHIFQHQLKNGLHNEELWKIILTNCKIETGRSCAVIMKDFTEIVLPDIFAYTDEAAAKYLGQPMQEITSAVAKIIFKKLPKPVTSRESFRKVFEDLLEIGFLDKKRSCKTWAFHYYMKLSLENGIFFGVSDQEVKDVQKRVLHAICQKK